jgi:hypothetical protein
MSNDWLKRILADTERRVAEKPEWQRSEYAQHELARLRAEAHAKGPIAANSHTPPDSIKKDR